MNPLPGLLDISAEPTYEATTYFKFSGTASQSEQHF